METSPPRTLLITGASSGIGAALARAYADAGVVLHLGGRDQARLEATAIACRKAGATVVPRRQDVTDAPEMAAWIAEASAQGPPDLVIANAGISGEAQATATGGPSPAVHPPGLSAKILAVNLTGVINTVYPALDSMMGHPPPAGGGRRQIAIMSSLAGFRGMHTAPAYCASKAALRTLAESLRVVSARHGIGVSVICPGFVESAMTERNPFPMPLLMPADRAARIIKRGLERNRRQILFPFRLATAARVLTALPSGMSDHMFRRIVRNRN